MSDDYVLPEGANPETCGITLTNYKSYGCRCEKCRKLKSVVNRKGRYGLSAQDYEKLCEDQKYRCALCGKEAELHVDHDHDTQQIRGLLCQTCNTGIGKLGDTVGSLEKAIGYLRGEFVYDVTEFEVNENE